MSALGITSIGYQCEDTALGLVTLGYICDGFVPTPEPPAPEPIPEGAGGGARMRTPWYDEQRDRDLEQTRRKRILAEDEEVAALIAALITRDIL